MTEFLNYKKTILILIILFSFFCVVENSEAEVIFSDDFESYPSDWECDDGAPGSWGAGWLDGHPRACMDPDFGSTMKAGTGYNGGNGIDVWKKGDTQYLTDVTGYNAEMDVWVNALYGHPIEYALTGSELHKTWYHRWYMKIPEPADFNKSAANGFKFWRYITIPNTAPNGLVLYLNVADINCFGSNTFTDGYISIFDPFIAVCAPMVAIADIDDNQWHSHELRVTLNSVGASDGAIEYWVDGVQTYSDTSVNFGYGAEGADYGLYRFGIGMGNTTEDVDWNQTEWSALSFDNVEVSDEYIGPLESSDTTPPSAPSGLGVS